MERAECSDDRGGLSTPIKVDRRVALTGLLLALFSIKAKNLSSGPLNLFVSKSSSMLVNKMWRFSIKEFSPGE